MCFPSRLRQNKPYPLLSQGLCVREGIATWTRNNRERAKARGHGLNQSVTANWPQARRIRARAESADKPQTQAVHFRSRGNKLSVSVNYQRTKTVAIRQRSRT